MMKKPVIGGRYKLSDGTNGRIMSVSLVESEYYLGHVSFNEWFNRHNTYEIIVAYEMKNGNVNCERITLK